VCDDCPDPQLCLDTNTCALLDEMTRIAQDSGQYENTEVEMTVYELAHECLENNNWDWGTAAEEMENRIWQDQRLRDELMKPFIGRAITDTLFSLVRGLER